MLSSRRESTHMMFDRCSSGSNSGSGSGSGSGSNYNSGRMEWSTQVSTRSPSSPPATPRPGARAGAGAPVAGHGTIRVIHIFAPKIIKTDVANFKQLVQRLTGNSSSKRFGGSRGKTSKRGGGVKAIAPSSSRGQQILSHYSNATQIFASSNRVEYVIPRSSTSAVPSKPCFSHGPTTSSRLGMEFYRREDPSEFLMDIKPVVTLREPSFAKASNNSSDQSCSSSFLREVSSPHGHNSNYLNNQQSKDSSNIFFSRNGTRSIGARMPARSGLKTFCGDQGQHGSVEGSLSSPRQPLVADPFQSLSGYKEKLSSPPPKSSSTTATGFPLIDDRNHHQNPLLRTSRFCDMEILTGLVKPGPNEHLPDTPQTWASHQLNYNSNSPSDFTFPTGQLNNSSSLCRFSVPSPLHGGVSPLFENF